MIVFLPWYRWCTEYAGDFPGIVCNSKWVRGAVYKDYFSITQVWLSNLEVTNTLIVRVQSGSLTTLSRPNNPDSRSELFSITQSLAQKESEAVWRLRTSHRLFCFLCQVSELGQSLKLLSSLRLKSKLLCKQNTLR